MLGVEEMCGCVTAEIPLVFYELIFVIVYNPGFVCPAALSVNHLVLFSSFDFISGSHSALPTSPRVNR